MFMSSIMARRKRQQLSWVSRAEDTIEIKSGLKKGDNVVTKGQTYLSDGEEVTIANTAAKTKEKTKTTEKGE